MIELSRDITFGQYINNGSSLSTMDPRTKLFCAILLIIVVSIVNTFSAFALCLLFFVVLHVNSRVPTLYVLRSYKPILAFLFFIFIIQILFYTPTHRIPYLWQWGVLSVSWEGIISSARIMIRVLLLFYLTLMLTFTTSLVDLTDGLEALLAPLQKIGIPINAFIMVLVIGFKFVPIFVTEVERLMKAQLARGVRFDKGNFIQRTLKLAPLLIPLFVSGFKRAEVLSTAMEARCYGGRPGWRRSKRRALHFARYDAIVLILTCVTCVVALLIPIFVPI